MNDMDNVHARLTYQHKLEYQTVLSARLDKQNEEYKVLDEIEFHKKLNINRNLTDSDIDNMNVRSLLEQDVLHQETKDWGWRFNKNNSMTMYFCKTTEFNGSSYLFLPLKYSAFFLVEDDVILCFNWSILAHLHPIADLKNGHTTSVSI